MSSLHPSIVITIDGQPVSGLFLERLISVTITDKAGSTADTIDLELNAGAPFFAVPREKAIISAWIEEQYFGSFTADDRELSCLPYRLHIQGKSADMRDALKEHRNRHWDGATFGKVVNDIASENGLVAQVDPEIANYQGKDGYFAQLSESGLHFIDRHAQRLDGLFAIKDGKLIVAKKGSGATAGGSALGALTVVPTMIVKDTCKVKWTERGNHKKVRAGYHDPGEAKRKYEEAASAPRGTAIFTLRHNLANQQEAQHHAKAKANELQRDSMTTSVTIIGNVGARGGAPMEYDGVHPEADGQPFIIETAAHKFSKAGYVVDISAKTQIPASGGGGKGGGSGGEIPDIV
jgi:phage protein D